MMDSYQIYKVGHEKTDLECTERNVILWITCNNLIEVFMWPDTENPIGKNSPNS
jgi:hypothetical protein